MRNRNKPFFYEKKKTPFWKTALICITGAAFLLFLLFQIPDIRKIIAEPLFAAGSFAADTAKTFFESTRMYRDNSRPSQTKWEPLELPDKEILFAESLENLAAASEVDPLAYLRQTPEPEDYSRVAVWEYQDPELNYAVTYGTQQDHSETEIHLIPPVFEHADLNNDGTAILSAVLRFWGEIENQYQIADQIHPDPLDPEISFTDLESYISQNYPDYGVLTRINGDADLLIKLLRIGVPILIRTQYTAPYSFWLRDDRFTAKYILINGYESESDTFFYQDTFRGNSQQITSTDLLADWYPFQRKYMLLYPADKEAEVQESLSEDFFEELNLQKADSKFRMDSQMLPNDPFAQYNFGTVLFSLGDYGGAMDYFKIASDLTLPQRYINYQTEILESALRMGYADEIETLTKQPLSRNSHDEILCVYKGWADLTRGDQQKAAESFENAGKINPGSEMVLYALKYKETMMQP